MLLVYLTHGLLFCSLPFRTNLLGEPLSLLVVANIHPLLPLVGQQLPHPLLVLPPFHNPQTHLQYLHRRHQQLQPSSSDTPHITYTLVHLYHITCTLYHLHHITFIIPPTVHIHIISPIAYTTYTISPSSYHLHHITFIISPLSYHLFASQ
jgi:hypothetical protein